MDLTVQRPPKPLGTAFRGSACNHNFTLLKLEIYQWHKTDKIVRVMDLDVMKVKTLVDVFIDLAHLQRTVAKLCDDHALFL